MRRDDRDDPFDDIFRELERLMDEMMGGGGPRHELEATGFGADAHVDVHETDSEIRVVADLPSVDQEDLHLRCDGTVLTISVDDVDRRISERISLPARVDERSADATFNNGVLEVVLQRTDDSASIDL